MIATLLTATSSLFLAISAQAAPAGTSCLVAPALTRVEFLVGGTPGCCDGKLRCTQYLATTKIARGRLDPHS